MGFESSKVAELIFSMFMAGCVMAVIVKIIWDFLTAPKNEVIKIRQEFNDLRKSFDKMNLELLSVVKKVENVKTEGALRIDNLQTFINHSSEKFKNLYESISEVQTCLAVLAERLEKEKARNNVESFRAFNKKKGS